MKRKGDAISLLKKENESPLIKSGSLAPSPSSCFPIVGSLSFTPPHSSGHFQATILSLASQGDWTTPAERIPRPAGSTPRGELFKAAIRQRQKPAMQEISPFLFLFFFSSICKCSLMLLRPSSDSEMQSCPTELCLQGARECARPPPFPLPLRTFGVFNWLSSGQQWKVDHCRRLCSYSCATRGQMTEQMMLHVRYFQARAVNEHAYWTKDDHDPSHIVFP